MTSNGHDTDHAANPSSVLVVDDEPVIRSLMDSFLTKEGYEVTTADDGQQAVQLMEGVHFDLIITDLMMPVLDGVGVLRASKHADPDRPVIIMTGYPSTESVREMIRLGAADYIVKPFNVDVVQGTVAKILELRQLAAGSEAPTPEDSAAVDSVTGAYDFQTFVDLLETELGRSELRRHYCSLLVIKVGRFHHVEAKRGQHLKQVVELLRGTGRPGDVVGWTDQQELVMILPETHPREARSLRQKILNNGVLWTMTTGLASFPQHATNAASLINAARATMTE